MPKSDERAQVIVEALKTWEKKGSKPSEEVLKQNWTAIKELNEKANKVANDFVAGIAESELARLSRSAEKNN